MYPQIACTRRGIVGLVRFPIPSQSGPCLSRLNLLDFSPLCVFKCLLKSPACVDAKSHWLHLFDFSPMCVFKCLLKSPAREDAKSHWLHLYDFSPLCLFKCALNVLQAGRSWRPFGERKIIPQSFRRARVYKFSRQKRCFLQNCNFAWILVVFGLIMLVML